MTDDEQNPGKHNFVINEQTISDQAKKLGYQIMGAAMKDGFQKRFQQ